MLVFSSYSVLNAKPAESSTNTATVETKARGQDKILALDELIRVGKYDEALKLSQALEKEYPQKRSELRSRRALAFMYMGNNEQAIKESKAALKADAKDYYAHWVLSCVYASQGRKKESMDEFKEANKNRPQGACELCKEKSKIEMGSEKKRRKR